MNTKADLRVSLGSLSLKNPVMTASGTFGYAREFETYLNLNRLGGIVVKGLSLKPSKGNPPPRVVETPCGMLNAIGLENVGVEAFARDKLPFLESLETPVFTNIYGTRVEEYAALAERIENLSAVAGIEINISCPNVKAGGVAFGVDPAGAAKVVREVRRRFTRTLIVKLSPNVSDVALVARRVEDEGADAISLINTITGMVVDVERRRPVLANVTGGLSGPAIRPVAVRMVWQVCRQVSVPVIGIGGIMNVRDALEFLIVGATAVQVGTANFVNPRTSMDIVDGLENWLAEKGIERVTDIIGALEA
ncbi:MAG TPA: dihydroorotate dehydrogenase [Desulfobacterales bacterium]